MKSSLWLAVVIALLAAPASAASKDDELTRFLAKRSERAAALAVPIAACVKGHDTKHPVFSGCIDWHSSVHGVWALSAFARVTGDARYRALVLSLLEKDALETERSYLAGHPRFEMPYGRAWFLRLAIDYRRAFGDDRLDAMAADVARSLMAHYSRVSPDPHTVAYGNATWALINLHDYGVFRNDPEILGFVKGKVEAHYLDRGACPLAMEVETREFMAVCTNWAWLVGKVQPREAFKAWLRDFLPPRLAIEPIEEAASVHQAGLNFSRAWGLWHLYRLTGERRFLDAYLAHFKSTFERPEIWNGDYATLSHWVAQFGMLAIVVSYDDEPTAGMRTGP